MMGLEVAAVAVGNGLKCQTMVGVSDSVTYPYRQAMVEDNQGAFGETEVRVQRVLWGEALPPNQAPTDSLRESV